MMKRAMEKGADLWTAMAARLVGAGLMFAAIVWVSV